MSRIALSLIISCEYDLQSDTTQVRIVRVDTGENVRLRDGSFLLRCSMNGQTRGSALSDSTHCQRARSLRASRAWPTQFHQNLSNGY